MIKNLHNALFLNDSGNALLSSDEMHILRVDLNNINLHDVNFCEGDPETILHARLMAW